VRLTFFFWRSRLIHRHRIRHPTRQRMPGIKRTTTEETNITVICPYLIEDAIAIFLKMTKSDRPSEMLLDLLAAAKRLLHATLTLSP